ncbi:MAG: HEAT repeat domain-containing protein [Nanoarchaeota archaeon]
MQLDQLLNDLRHIGEECFNGYSFQKTWRGVYLPSMLTAYEISDNIYFTHFRAEERSIAEKNAHLLRLSILDEDLPINVPLIINPNFIVSFGGRMANVITLGRIKYYPALPELNEIALHDLDEGMQYEALDAIGEFGAKAQRYEMGIAEHMISLPVNWVQAQAAKTLGEIGTQRSFDILKELYEYISGIMRTNERKWHMTGDEKYFRQMSHIRDGARNTLQSMVQIDRLRGEQVLKYALQDESGGVRHEAKTVKFFYKNNI